MKVYTKICVVISVVVCVLTLWGGISLAVPVTDQENPHNLSYAGPNFKYMTMQVCVFCHTPHGGNTDVHTSTYWNSTGYKNLTGTGSMLLWNRDITNSANFYTYQSSTFQGGSDEIRVYSLMCMSCHDGVSAINVMSNLPNREWSFWGGDTWYILDGKPAVQPFFPLGPTDLGGLPPDIGDRSGTTADLSNDHPVSFDYDADLINDDTGLVTPNAAGYVGDPAVKLFPNRGGDLVSLECSTCHDVHEWVGGYREPFLVISNQNSALCLNCHIK
jgi:hypothetical protein